MGALLVVETPQSPEWWSCHQNYRLVQRILTRHFRRDLGGCIQTKIRENRIGYYLRTDQRRGQTCWRWWCGGGERSKRVVILTTDSVALYGAELEN